MRFLRRRVVIAVCILVALGALALHPMSYRNHSFVGWQRMEQGEAPDCHSAELFVTRGSLGFETYARDTFWLSTIQLSPPDWWGREGFYAGTSRAYPVAAMSPQDSFQRLGFHFHHENATAAQRAVVLRHSIVAVPLWLVVLMTVIPPVVGFFRRRRARHESRCPDCGYDVRATPHRCPECGRNISPASATTTASRTARNDRPAVRRRIPETASRLRGKSKSQFENDAAPPAPSSHASSWYSLPLDHGRAISC